MDLVSCICAASVTVNACCLLYWVLKSLFVMATKERKDKSKKWSCHGLLVGREQTLAKMVVGNLSSWLLGTAVIYTLSVEKDLWNHPFLPTGSAPHSLMRLLLSISVGKHIFCIFFACDFPLRHLHLAYNIISVFYLGISLIWSQNYILCSLVLLVDMNTLMTQTYAVVKDVYKKKERTTNERPLKVLSIVTAIVCFVCRAGMPVGFLIYSLLVASPLRMSTICVVVFFIGVVFYGSSNCWLLCFYVSEFKRRVLLPMTYFQKIKAKQEKRESAIFKALPGVPRKLYGANLISHLMKTSQTSIDIETAPYKMNNVVQKECNIGRIDITTNKL